MRSDLPTEAELRNRIQSHLAVRPTDPRVASAWHGYLVGLLEWGAIDLATHDRLLDLLPRTNRNEIAEIMLGVDSAA